MKNVFKITLLMIALALIFFGGEEVMATGLILAAPPVVLDTQKIVFLTSLKEEYKATDTWLKAASDLSAFVKDGQTLVFPEAGEDPAVYKNRVTDVDSVEPTETTHEVALDVYDSQNYKLRNINLHALPFDKVQYYTKKSADAIIRQEIEDAAHAFCADVDSAAKKKFICGSTGDARDGLKMMTIEDVITAARIADQLGFPDDGRNLVLPSDMWWDLVNSNNILKGQLERAPLNGIIKPVIVDYYGFKIHKSTQNLGLGYDLDEGKKAAQGATITGDVVPAGLIFVEDEVFHAGGQFEMFRQVKSQNTAGRAEEFGFQHRFKAGHQMSDRRYSGMVYLSKSV